MRRVVLALLACIALAATVPGSVLAGVGNPSPTGKGPPSQSCQEVKKEEGHTPGKSEGAPGSPFNEAGTAGEKYNEERSQYDVACYHVSH